MKKLIISLLLFYLCSGTFKQCSEASSDCASISIEHDGISCFEGDDQCYPLPTNGDIQKSYFKLFEGFQEEQYSAYLHSDDEEFAIITSKKETYAQGDTIEWDIKTLSNDIITKIRSNKTCGFNLIGRSLLEVEKGYSDITDKNVCFNAVQFEAFKNLVDCGYAEISFSLDGESYNLKTCYLIPNNKMPTQLNSIYMNYIVNEGENGLLKGAMLLKANKRDEFDALGRRLSEINYEVQVENKNGKKVKYSSGKSEIQLISAGSESSTGSEGLGEETQAGQGLKFTNLILILLVFMHMIL